MTAQAFNVRNLDLGGDPASECQGRGLPGNSEASGQYAPAWLTHSSIR